MKKFIASMLCLTLVTPGAVFASGIGEISKSGTEESSWLGKPASILAQTRELKAIAQKAQLELIRPGVKDHLTPEELKKLQLLTIYMATHSEFMRFGIPFISRGTHFFSVLIHHVNSTIDFSKSVFFLSRTVSSPPYMDKKYVVIIHQDGTIDKDACTRMNKFHSFTDAQLQSIIQEEINYWMSYRIPVPGVTEV